MLKFHNEIHPELIIVIGFVSILEKRSEIQLLNSPETKETETKMYIIHLKVKQK